VGIELWRKPVVVVTTSNFFGSEWSAAEVLIPVTLATTSVATRSVEDIFMMFFDIFR
jgi:hypothetical protein